MYLFLVALHAALCLGLIGIILLQPGKGSDAAAAFGGGSGAGVFGPRGPANALTRVTAVVAVMFMVTSISLALYSDKRGPGDVQDALERMQQEQGAANGEAPAEGAATVQPEGGATEAVAVPVESGAAPVDVPSTDGASPAGGAAPVDAPAAPVDGTNP